MQSLCAQEQQHQADLRRDDWLVVGRSFDLEMTRAVGLDDHYVSPAALEQQRRLLRLQSLELAGADGRARYSDMPAVLPGISQMLEQTRHLGIDQQPLSLTGPGQVDLRRGCRDHTLLLLNKLARERVHGCGLASRTNKSDNNR